MHFYLTPQTRSDLTTRTWSKGRLVKRQPPCCWHPAARQAMQSYMQLRGYALWGHCERGHSKPHNATISQTWFFTGEKVTQLNRTHCTFWNLEFNWIYTGFLFWVSVTAFLIKPGRVPILLTVLNCCIQLEGGLNVFKSSTDAMKFMAHQKISHRKKIF